MRSRQSWIHISFVISSLALSAVALSNGATNIEAGSWSIRNAIRVACNRDQGELGYRNCLSNAVLDIYKSNFVAYELNDYCADRRRCALDKQNVARIKNCFHTVSVVNKGLPRKNWHANLYEDIMVGCLSKETLNRIVHFGPGPVRYGPPFKTPYKINHLANFFGEVFRAAKISKLASNICVQTSKSKE